MSDLRIYGLEAWTELLKVLRLPAYALPTIGFPAIFYVLFALALGGRQASGTSVGTYMLATYGAFGVMGASLFGFGVSLAIERAQGWLLLKRSMPAPPGAWIVGKLAVSLAFSLAVVVVLSTLGVLFGHVRMPLGTWVPLVAVLVAGALPFSAFGLALGYLLGPNSAPAVVNLIYLPMAFFSGMWVPIEMLPNVMKQVALCLPAYHFAQLALAIVGAGRGGPAWSHVLFLVGFTLFSVALALFAYRRDEGVTFG
ncbi:MAG TPA: ABC transporter permease [Vicinamibacterales bacterium]